MLSRDEMKRLLESMQGHAAIMASLLYGAGLRVLECVTLRVQDLDLSNRLITVRNSKGRKARIVPIPLRLVEPLQRHLLWRQQLHVDDRLSGWGYVEFLGALHRKYRTQAITDGPGTTLVLCHVNATDGDPSRSESETAV